ncbi:unnamed protein product [Coffea canephora]|uniref:Uncharacterized protein n=1 Tax=Coffea canephora TaxID=49390 RepID=A0A068UM28_COFCA|nr:unnamed protein product [Coffea canephora]
MMMIIYSLERRKERFLYFLKAFLKMLLTRAMMIVLTLLLLYQHLTCNILFGSQCKHFYLGKTLFG